MIPIQAAIGGKIIARESIRGFKRCINQDSRRGRETVKKNYWINKKKEKQEPNNLEELKYPQEAFKWSTENKQRDLGRDG